MADVLEVFVPHLVRILNGSIHLDEAARLLKPLVHLNSVARHAFVYHIPVPSKFAHHFLLFLLLSLNFPLSSGVVHHALMLLSLLFHVLILVGLSFVRQQIVMLQLLCLFLELLRLLQHALLIGFKNHSCLGCFIVHVEDVNLQPLLCFEWLLLHFFNWLRFNDTFLLLIHDLLSLGTKQIIGVGVFVSVVVEAFGCELMSPSMSVTFLGD